MAQFRFEGATQYRTQQEGIDCDAWLTNWRAQHATEITAATQSLITDNVPDDGQGCVCQLSFDLSFDTEVADAQVTYRAELLAAIYVGGTAGDADCNSYVDF